MTKEQQLLKEAAEALKEILGYQGPVGPMGLNTAKETLQKLENHFSQPLPEPVTALSWEDALNDAAKEYGFFSYEDLEGYTLSLETSEENKVQKLKNVLKQAAHLFMEANRVSRWIPVEERLPNFNTPVLVHAIDKRPFMENEGPYHQVCFLDNDGCFYGPSMFRFETATHWQPLPEIPKEFKG